MMFARHWSSMTDEGQAKYFKEAARFADKKGQC